MTLLKGKDSMMTTAAANFCCPPSEPSSSIFNVAFASAHSGRKEPSTRFPINLTHRVTSSYIINAFGCK